MEQNERPVPARLWSRYMKIGELREITDIQSMYASDHCVISVLLISSLLRPVCARRYTYH